MRALLVEDEPIALNDFARTLEKAGHSVDKVPCGGQALAHLRVEKDNYDVLVVDLMTPNMGGLEFLYEAKKQDMLKCPVIVVTAYDPAHCSGLDCASVILCKPILSETLLECVEKFGRAPRDGVRAE